WIASQDQGAGQVQAGSRRGSLPDVIALWAADRHHATTALLARLCEEELELARFVPAGGEPRLVVAFYVDLRSTKLAAKALELFDRGREKAELNSRRISCYPRQIRCDGYAQGGG